MRQPLGRPACDQLKWTIAELIAHACLLQYAGESDLQLERINVYFNEATGGERLCKEACLPPIALPESAVNEAVLLPLRTAHPIMWCLFAFAGRYVPRAVLLDLVSGVAWIGSCFLSVRP